MKGLGGLAVRLGLRELVHARVVLEGSEFMFSVSGFYLFIFIFIMIMIITIMIDFL